MLRPISIVLISTVSLTYPLLADEHSHEADIASAMASAPAEISAEATIMSHDDVVLRKGNNGWTCFPQGEEKSGDDEDDEDAGCYNTAWMAFAKAFEADEKAVAGAGALSYMLSGENPHTMILMPGKHAVTGYPTERGNGAWAMGVGTPWQHLMIPAGK